MRMVLLVLMLILLANLLIRLKVRISLMNIFLQSKRLSMSALRRDLRLDIQS